MDDSGVIGRASGEFCNLAEERAWRESRKRQELATLNLLWGCALVCIGVYLPLEYLARGGDLPPELLWPRLAILLAGAAVLLVLRRPPPQPYRDWITSAGLVLAMTCYGAMLAARGQQSAGALLLLVLGSYLFSPGSFSLHCSAGVAGSLGAAYQAAGSLPWLELSYLVPANLLAALALGQLNRERRRLYLQRQRLRREVEQRRLIQERLEASRRRNLALLYNALPGAVVLQLQRSPHQRPARHHPGATLLFADIVGFTTLARRLSAPQLLRLLDALFSAFDAVAERRGLEKIKTIGDAYFAAAGLSTAERRPAARAAGMALDLRRAAAETGRRWGLPLVLRTGLHTGPVVSGVLGQKRFAFDLWGDAVNIASRLQAAAPRGGILVSEQTFRDCGAGYRFGPLQTLELRGCGRVQAARLLGPLPAVQLPQNLRGDGFR
jgi:class 3 adenylate cyclase